MKKILIFLTIILINGKSTVLAQTPVITTDQDQNESTPAAKPTIVPSTQMEKIQELKERIATKVAQLRLSKKKVLSGKITNLDSPLFTITENGNFYKIEVNEDTIITLSVDGKTKQIKFSDLKINQPIIAWGNYIQEGETLTAKGIFVKETFLALVGTINDVDIKGGTVTLQTVKTNQSYLLDVETFTKINKLDKDNKIVKLGFSKAKVGSSALIYAIPASKEGAAPYTAYRILILPNTSSATPTVLLNISPASSPSAIPTKIISPTRKPTPTAAE